jgi:hypothetical protein
MFARLVETYTVPIVETSVLGIPFYQFGEYGLGLFVLTGSKPFLCLILTLAQYGTTDA